MASSLLVTDRVRGRGLEVGHFTYIISEVLLDSFGGGSFRHGIKTDTAIDEG